MGYTTDFDGQIDIEPPLSEKEVKYINKFAETRRMDRENGPYYVGGEGDFGQAHDADIRDYNKSPEGQPGLWCGWVATEEGDVVEWDGGEKFYYSVEWMQYIIDHFIGENPLAKLNDPENFGFLQGHKCNGEIYAQGEESDDCWMLEVVDGKVNTKQGSITYSYE